MKIIDKYIVRAFLWNYLISLCVMMSLYIIIDLYMNLDEFLKNSDPALRVVANIVSYYGCNLFVYFSQLAGLITIVAAATTLARMQRSNELPAMLASGMSLYRVAAPLIVMSLLMNGLWIVDQEFVIPGIADKLARPRDDAEGLRAYQVWFVPDGNGGLLSALNYSPASKKIRHMLVIRRSPEGSLKEVITAEMADWDPTAKVWDLTRGRSYPDMPFASNDPARQQTQIRPRSVAVYNGGLNPKELMYRQSAQWTDFLSLRQISQMQKQELGPQTRLAKVKHSRVTTPIMNVIMLIIGIYAFLHRHPRPIVNDATISLVLSGFVFATTFVATNLINCANVSSVARVAACYDLRPNGRHITGLGRDVTGCAMPRYRRR